MSSGDACRGHYSTGEYREFECDYEFSGAINCEDCIFGLGTLDPRIDYGAEEEEEEEE